MKTRSYIADKTTRETKIKIKEFVSSSLKQYTRCKIVKLFNKFNTWLWEKAASEKTEPIQREQDESAVLKGWERWGCYQLPGMVKRVERAQNNRIQCDISGMPSPV